jgi:hemerythrin
VVVARLQAALARGTAGESAQVMVRFIQENSALHFLAEEALLAASGHLRLAAHQAEHQALTRLLIELGRALEDRAAAPALEAMGVRLADGLGRHLAAGDRQLEGPRPGVAPPA